MECRNLFSGNERKHIISLSSAYFAKRMVKGKSKFPNICNINQTKTVAV